MALIKIASRAIIYIITLLTKLHLYDNAAIRTTFCGHADITQERDIYVDVVKREILYCHAQHFLSIIVFFNRGQYYHTLYCIVRK